MQSKKSCFNATIIKKDLLHFLPAWLLYLVVLLVRFPVALLSDLVEIREEFGYPPEEIPVQRSIDTIWILQSGFAPLIFAVASLAFAMLLFYYLHFAKSSNMIHAYPVTRTQLFCSHLLSGMLMVTVPIVITGLCQLGVVASVDMRLAGAALFWMLWALVSGTLFFGIAVFLCMVTGILLAVPVFYLCALYLVEGLSYLVSSIIRELNYGCSVIGISYSSLFRFFTPMDYLSYETDFSIPIYDSKVLWQAGIRYQGVKGMIVYLVVAAVLFVLAHILYQRRKLEDVGKVITVRFLRPIFQWGVSFTGGAVLSLLFFTERSYFKPANQFPLLLLSFLAFSVLIWYLLEVIMTRRWKAMTRRKWGELAAYLAMFTVLFTLMECDAFGIEKRVPEADRVAAVFLDANRQYAFTDPEEIEEILSLHRELTMEKKEVEAAQNEYFDFGQWINIDYYGTNGERLSRSYCVPKSPETVSLPSMAMMDKIDRNEDYFLRSVLCVNYPEAVITGGETSVPLLGTELGSDYAMAEMESVMFTPEEAGRLYEAMCSDFREGAYLRNYTEYTEEPEWYENDLTFYFRVPGGRAITQYELLEKYEDDPEDYLYGDTEYAGDYTESAWIGINERCSHILETLSDIVPEGTLPLSYGEDGALEE